MNENNEAKIDNSKCIQCGACVYQCPFGAITDKSFIIDAIEILKNGNRFIEGGKPMNVFLRIGCAALDVYAVT